MCHFVTTHPVEQRLQDGKEWAQLLTTAIYDGWTSPSVDPTTAINLDLEDAGLDTSNQEVESNADPKLSAFHGTVYNLTVCRAMNPEKDGSIFSDFIVLSLYRTLHNCPSQALPLEPTSTPSQTLPITKIRDSMDRVTIQDRSTGLDTGDETDLNTKNKPLQNKDISKVDRLPSGPLTNE